MGWANCASTDFLLLHIVQHCATTLNHFCALLCGAEASPSSKSAQLRRSRGSSEGAATADGLAAADITPPTAAAAAAAAPTPGDARTRGNGGVGAGAAAGGHGDLGHLDFGMIVAQSTPSAAAAAASNIQAVESSSLKPAPSTKVRARAVAAAQVCTTGQPCMRAVLPRRNHAHSSPGLRHLLLRHDTGHYACCCCNACCLFRCL